MILTALLFSSCAFFVAAQNSSSTSNNIFSDSDQDGLTDTEEKLYGTDPHKADTDGDGYTDGSEVAAGYDPLKPAPGDRFIDEENTTTNASASQDSTNLTMTVAKKISGLTTQQADPSNPQVSSDQIQTIVDEALTSQNQNVDLPQIDKSTIHIKKQDYPKSQREAKKKEDFSEYIAKVFYIFTSNSPLPITSSSDITSAMTQVVQQIISSLSTQNSSSLNSLSTSGETILKQLGEMEVPEDLVDLHIKAMQYATYSASLKDMVNTDQTDPLASVVNFSKIGAFVQSLSSFSSDAQSKLDEYDVDYSDIQDKVKSLGVELPNIEDLDSASSAISKISGTDTSTSTSSK